MKLHEMIEILNADRYSVDIENNDGNVTDSFHVMTGSNDPGFTGHFWSKGQKDAWKHNKQMLKLYGECEIIRITTTLGLSIYVKEGK